MIPANGESGTYGVPNSLFTLVPGRLVSQKRRISLNAICCSSVQAEGDRSALHILMAREGAWTIQGSKSTQSSRRQGFCSSTSELSFLTKQGKSCIWGKEDGPVGFMGWLSQAPWRTLHSPKTPGNCPHSTPGSSAALGVGLRTQVSCTESC